MTWQQGASVIEGMIRKRELDRVQPARAHADQLLAQADHHLQAALAVLPIDPTGAYQLIYDAARKSLAAVLGSRAFGPPAGAATSRCSPP